MRRLSRLSLPLQFTLPLLLLPLLPLGGADDLGRGEEGEGDRASYPCFHWFLLQGLLESQDAASRFRLNIISELCTFFYFYIIYTSYISTL